MADDDMGRWAWVPVLLDRARQFETNAAKSVALNLRAAYVGCHDLRTATTARSYEIAATADAHTKMSILQLRDSAAEASRSYPEAAVATGIALGAWKIGWAPKRLSLLAIGLSTVLQGPFAIKWGPTLIGVSSALSAACRKVVEDAGLLPRP